jgi:hypothetical protein
MAGASGPPAYPITRLPASEQLPNRKPSNNLRRKDESRGKPLLASMAHQLRIIQLGTVASATGLLWPLEAPAVKPATHGHAIRYNAGVAGHYS